MLTELEQKLLALALDHAAQPGEWATAAMKLIQSLRERGVDGHGGIKQKMDPSGPLRKAGRQVNRPPGAAPLDREPNPCRQIAPGRGRPC